MTYQDMMATADRELRRIRTIREAFEAERATWNPHINAPTVAPPSNLPVVDWAQVGKELDHE